MINFFNLRKIAGLVTELDLKNKSGFCNESLFIEFAQLAPNLLNKVQIALQWVLDYNINCVIVGGIAVENYLPGSRQLTDIDFLAVNIADVTMKAKLNNLHVDAHLEMSNTGETGIHLQEIDADFIAMNSGNKSALHKEIINTARTEQIGNGQFKVISPELLTITKFEAGRQKDMDDAFKLLTSGQLNKQLYLKSVRNLKNSVDDPQTLALYADIIR